MICPYCKTELPDEYSFCHSCGKDVRSFWEADLSYELSRYFNIIDTIFPRHIIDAAYWNQELNGYSSSMAQKTGYDRILDFLHAHGYKVIDSRQAVTREKQGSRKRKKNNKTLITVSSVFAIGLIILASCLILKDNSKGRVQNNIAERESSEYMWFSYDNGDKGGGGKEASGIMPPPHTDWLDTIETPVTVSGSQGTSPTKAYAPIQSESADAESLDIETVSPVTIFASGSVEQFPLSDRVTKTGASKMPEPITEMGSLEEHTITAVFNPNGGEAAPGSVEAVTGEDGAARFIVPDTVPYRDGYAFAGWSLSFDDADELYSPGQSVTAAVNSKTGTLVYYAQWQLAE